MSKTHKKTKTHQNRIALRFLTSSSKSYKLQIHSMYNKFQQSGQQIGESGDSGFSRLNIAFHVLVYIYY